MYLQREKVNKLNICCQYLKDFGSNRFSFVREIAERVVEQNNQLIQKLESFQKNKSV